MYTLAVKEFQSQHQTILVPSWEEIEGAIAANAIMPLLSTVGITADLSRASKDDLLILLKASGFLDSVSGWVRCDAVGNLCKHVGVDGILQLKEEAPQMYTELLQITGAGLGTLQNDLTTFKSWPRSRRSESATYSHHVALNPLPYTLRLSWLETVEAEGWSVARTRYNVAEFLKEEQPDDEEKYSRFGETVLRWSYMVGARMEVTNNSLTITKDGYTLTVEAYILPSGRAAIKLGDE